MISFNHDPAVTDALRQWRTRTVLPTGMGSAELRGVPREIHLRSITSARTTSAEYLSEVSEVIDEMLAGKINVATGRLRLLRKLAELGYDPERGFPGDLAGIPPAERGSLQDLSSRARLDLLLKTNVAMARNYGRVVAGNTPAALYAFPAWELVRLGVRETPRGFRRVHGSLVPDPPDAWQRRWAAAGESVLWEGVAEKAEGGRRKAEEKSTGLPPSSSALRLPPSAFPMIARKDSPIWQALGDGDGGDWTDTLGNPYPPFAFNSGMDWRAVPRAEAMALGLIQGARSSGERDEVAPMPARLAPDDEEIHRAAGKLREDLRAELLRELADWRAAA